MIHCVFCSLISFVKFNITISLWVCMGLKIEFQLLLCVCDIIARQNEHTTTVSVPVGI